MKKLFIIALASLFAFASCSKENNETPEVKDKTINLTFTSKRPQLKSDTKTAWDASSSSIVWTSGDKIRVGYTLDGDWMGQSEAGTAKFYTSSAVEIDESNSKKGTFKVPISNSSFTDPQTVGDYTFYAVYPSSVLTNATVTNPEEATVTLPSSQTPGVNTFDASSDIMVGKSSSLSLAGLPTTDAISLEWTRVVAHADLTFKDLRGVEDGETITKITLTAQNEAKLVGSFKVSVVDGTVDNSSASNVITIQGANLSFVTEDSKKNINAWIALLPAELTSLNVDIETNKAHYTRSITGISKTFKGNARNTLGIGMGSALRTPKSGQLVADGYYVVSYDNNMMTVGTESNAYRGYDTKNTSNPSAEAIWEITYVSESDAYTIHSVSADKDLYGTTSSGTTLSFSSGSGLINLFTIAKTNSESTTYKVSSLGGTRSIGYNISSPRFAMYLGNDSQPITIDLTPVSYVAVPTINITSDNPMSVAKTASTGNTISYTISNPTTANLTASSEATWIKNINYDTPGSVTFNVDAQESGAAARSGVITLSYTGAENVDVTVNQAGDEPGTQTNPFTVAQVREYMGASSSNIGPAYIRGIISSIVYSYNAGHATASFYISDDGETSSDQFEAYSVKFLGNNTWVNGNTQIDVGDNVIIYGGELTIYNSTYETKQNSGSYLYSLNGITSETVPTITKTDITGVSADGVSGATTPVTFTNNEGWTPSVTCDGTIVTSASISGNTITYSVAKNTGDARFGTITVSLSKTGRTNAFSTINVSQLSANSSETINFASLGLTNGIQYTDPFDGGNFTITFAGGANDGKYYTTGSGIRTYGGGSITIATKSSTKTIKEIVFTWDGDNAPTSDVASPTGYSTTTKKWTGEASSIVLTRPSGSGHWRLQTVKVTY